MSDVVFGSRYAADYDLVYRDKDYEAECDLIESVLHRYAQETVRTILDLGCGTGNHAIPLARRGYSVTGVDRSEVMLGIARRKAGAGPRFVQGDLRALELGSTFDAVIMMFAVLGYQVENADVRATLDSVRRHLRPGGLFLCDVWYGPSVLSVRPEDRVKVIDYEGGTVIRAAAGSLDSLHHVTDVHYRTWRVDARDGLVSSEEVHRMRFFFPLELELLFSVSGMRLVDLRRFDRPDLPPDDTSWNVYVLGQAAGGEAPDTAALPA